MPELTSDHPVVQARLPMIQARDRVFGQGMDALATQRRVRRVALAGKSPAERLMVLAGAELGHEEETPVKGEEEEQG
jgi:hypothetical protein